jgi:LCP family protein required for cell wall assembly
VGCALSETPTDTGATGKHRERKHRVLKTVAIAGSAVLVVLLVAGVLIYRHLDGNIQSLDVASGLGTDRPTAMPKKKGVPNKPMNVLLIGSDTRAGAGNKIGGDTPGLSDTTILLHLSGNRKLAYGVSLPRDAMVQRPKCKRKDGNGTDPGGLTQFNEAYAIGGAACTGRTIEQLTGVHIDHFVVIDFNGFKKMVDALGGVKVCVPRDVDDTIGHIKLPKGTYTVKGQRALDYVRVRHDIGSVDNGDIGRMKRQQAFLASMSSKAVSAGTLINPVRLIKFLDAATKSLSTDPGLASIGKLRSLASSFNGIGLDKIQFLTVPFQPYAPDPNRLQWAPEATMLWKRMIADEPVGENLSGEVTTAAGSRKPKRGQETPAAKSAAEKADENGLCA